MARRSRAVSTRVVNVIRGGYRRAKNKKASLAVIAGLVPFVMDAKAEYYAKGGQGIGIAMVRDFTGMNPNANYRFALANLGQGLLPLLAGYGVHKYIGRFVNPLLKGIPFIEL